MKKLILSFSILLFGTALMAQQSNSNFIPTIDKCKTDKAHKDLYATNPAYHQKFDEAQTQIRNIISSGVRGGGVYTIPVVVHVMHLGSAEGTNENISDAQIQSAIDNLNDAYDNLGYNGLDIDIAFALAVRDPNCQPTDGINRINASSLTSGGDAYATKGATDNNRTALKALSNWSSSDYYNIWIVTEIDDNNGGSGTQGYAYFPGAPNGTDGAVILYNAFGYDPTLSLGYNLKSYTNYNTTAIHELGHALDLFHTFEGDDANDDGTPDTCPPTAAGSGDECGDTHAHRRDDSDCQGGIDPTCNGVAGSTVFNNFMAYSSDICQDRFTADQKLRMRAAMEGPRASLLTSLALVTAPAQAPNTLANSCSPTSSSQPNEGVTDYYGGILSVTFGNRTSVTGATKDDHDDFGTFGYMDFSQDCLKYDEFEEGGNIAVTVGCHFNNHNVKVYVDWNNNGVFGAGEEALSLNTVGYTPSSGNITIPGGAVTGEFLRIRFNADIGTVNSACENATYGQIEDYAIFINPAGGGAPVAQFSANATTVCSGNTLTFTDASTDASTYSWNFGTGASPATATGVGPHVVTYTGSGTSTVTLDVTGPGGSDNETKTNYITRSSAVTPSVSISSNDGDNSICASTSVTFTASPTNGGTPSYQWKLNGGNVGSNSTTYINSSLADNDQISCVMTSTAACASPTTATSNTITMDVISSVAASVSIVASANPITTGDPVTFTATPTNGGTPSYQWKLNNVNVGSNSTTYNNSALANGDQVRCVMTSTATCASPVSPSSNTITMTVNGGSCSTVINGPAGVGNSNSNKVWLDASKLNLTNGAFVPSWADISGNNLTATPTYTSSRPIFRTNQLNGFPALDFDGTGDHLRIANVAGINNQAISWFVVGNFNTTAASQAMLHFAHNGGSYNKNLRFTICYNNGSTNRINSSNINTSGGGVPANHLFTTAPQILETVIGATSINTFSNGAATGSNTGTFVSPIGTNAYVTIGQRAFLNDMFLDGNVSEVIVYNYQLNAAERMLVENYLSSKYSLAVSTDLYTFESSGHYYNAAGIGMTAGVSHTSARGNIVEMNTASSLANGDFLMFAHNNAATSPTTTGTPSGYGGTGEMMTRVWRADKTNDVGTVTVNFYLDGIATGGSTDFELLVDSDGNFSNATRITSGFSYDSGCDVATWTGVNFTDGAYFTIGNPDGAALLVEPITEFVSTIETEEMEISEEESSALTIIDNSTESIQMTLYPNPTTGMLTIENIMNGANVELFNTLGQLVYSSTILTGKNQYDFSYLNNGIYIVHLKDINNETITISQLMIQK